ncbi:helix-turn-helix domain-containing protein [Salipaludibacillus sp. CF4.18]|uniref:helix-turn-helix domain-containing protein n=1 Tax=Salipaludibacillus sp. CF4.18 TaxID=3373081 RepID=UPI003EE7B19C
MEKINLEYIKQRRKDLNINLQEMAVLLGFKNASTYMKYEKGEYLFKANQLPSIAKILKCEINELFLNKTLLK